ncbi:MAG: S1C family serine protease [Rubrivivax sp.]
MKKVPLISRAAPPGPPPGTPPVAPPAAPRASAGASDPPSTPGTPLPRTRRQRLSTWAQRRAAPLWGLGGAALALAVVAALGGLRPHAAPITQDDIDAAVRESLTKEPLPSAAAAAYEAIAPSVVRVVGLGEGDEDDADALDEHGEKAEQRALGRSLGTGVVIVDNGTILTNLHVVAGARKVKVRFANGHESEATVVGVQAADDLAVLKASSLPDDLQAATLRSTADLRPGDQVIAVGHPFGIGPSVSAGVVSGLRREFRTEGETPGQTRTMGNLIQFDAAANPGNSGGPLVTMDGHVVGIVTAILNPSEQRTFIGIGFAVPIENAVSAVGMPPF